MKKIALVLTHIFFCSTLLLCMSSTSLAASASYNEILESYESVMDGTWEFEGDKQRNFKNLDGTPIRFTFDKTKLGITNDNRVLYQLSDLSGIGGEVLLCRQSEDGRKRIGFALESNGLTFVVYYLEISE